MFPFKSWFASRQKPTAEQKTGPIPRLHSVRNPEAEPDTKLYKARMCGHMTVRGGKVTTHGETRELEPRKVEADGTINDWCCECLGTMGITCAWCSTAIFVGDPITLYGPCEGHTPKEGATIYQHSPLEYVGCLRWNCADTGGDRAGFWTASQDIHGKPVGHVHRVPTPIEMALASGRTVIVGDLSNVREATR